MGPIEAYDRAAHTNRSRTKPKLAQFVIDVHTRIGKVRGPSDKQKRAIARNKTHRTFKGLSNAVALATAPLNTVIMDISDILPLTRSVWVDWYSCHYNTGGYGCQGFHMKDEHTHIPHSKGIYIDSIYQITKRSRNV